MQAFRTRVETNTISKELEAARIFLEKVLPPEMFNAFQMPKIHLWEDPGEEVRPYYNPKTNQIIFPSNIAFDDPQIKAQVAEWLVHELAHAVLQNYLNNLKKNGYTSIDYITEGSKVNAFSESFSYIMEHLYRYTHTLGVEDLSILERKEEIIERLKKDITQDLRTDKFSEVNEIYPKEMPDPKDNAAASEGEKSIAEINAFLHEIRRELIDVFRNTSNTLDSLRGGAKISPKEQLEAAMELVKNYESSNYDKIGVFVLKAFTDFLSSSL